MTYVPPETTPEKWVIELNRYQRDNLLWLLLACWGWNEGGVIEPLNFAGTGDWVGEIPHLLMRPGRSSPCLDASDHPNWTHDQLREAIGYWLDQKIKKAMEQAR
jgi:hypothetical protein